MAAHFMDCFATGVSDDAAKHVERALERAGRHILSQKDACEKAPRFLRWQVREIRDGSHFLYVDESGEGGWDPLFSRALSAEVEGIVVARESHRHQERYGFATFLFGRTVEFAEKRLMDGTLVHGGFPVEEAHLPGFPDTLFESRFAELGNTLAYNLFESRIVQEGSWAVTPPAASFNLEPPEQLSWIFLPNVEEVDWIRVVERVPGWAWRPGNIRGASFIELRRSGTFDEAEAAFLSSHLPCSVAALEIPGGGMPYHWAEAFGGSIEARGQDEGAESLLKFLYRAAVYIGEGPGMIFGQGGAWMRPARETKP